MDRLLLAVVDDLGAICRVIYCPNIKGRTIRQVILGSLAAPTLLTFLWIAAFGGAALKIEKTSHQQTSSTIVTNIPSSTSVDKVPTHELTITEATQQDPARAVFVFFDHLTPNSDTKIILSALLCLLLAIHVITLVNSGILVLCFLDSSGATDPSIGIRLIWSAIIPLIGGGLLLAGGLTAIKQLVLLRVFLSRFY